MPKSSIQDVNLEAANALRKALLKEAMYLDVRVLPDGSVAALCELLYTRSVILGCTQDSWARRFCFKDRALATKRFGELQSEDDVPEGFIATRGLPFSTQKTSAARS